MKNDKNDATTHLNNNQPSHTSEGLKNQTHEEKFSQADALLEAIKRSSGSPLITLSFPHSPEGKDIFYWSNGVNSLQHEIRQLLCFKPLPGRGIDSFYFDVVKNIETGGLRIRLDWRWAPCWRDIKRLDCESISAAIVSLMKEHQLNAIMLNEQSVVNCCPDILNKSEVAGIINAGLQNSSQAGFIALPEFMETRYEEDESEYDNEQIYTRVF